MRALALVGYLLFALLVIWAAKAYLSYAQVVYDDMILPRVPPVALARPQFNETGVITFYAQNNGTKPWLVYDSGKGIATRALACAFCGTNLIPAYGARPVRVTGTLVGEHVDVVEIRPATDANQQFFTASLNTSGRSSGVTLTPRIVGGGRNDAVMWADVAHDDTTELLFFKQGELVPVGARHVTLLYARGGTYRFAVTPE